MNWADTNRVAILTCLLGKELSGDGFDRNDSRKYPSHGLGGSPDCEELLLEKRNRFMNAIVGSLSATRQKYIERRSGPKRSIALIPMNYSSSHDMVHVQGWHKNSHVTSWAAATLSHGAGNPTIFIVTFIRREWLVYRFVSMDDDSSEFFVLAEFRSSHFSWMRGCLP